MIGVASQMPCRVLVLLGVVYDADRPQLPGRKVGLKKTHRMHSGGLLRMVVNLCRKRVGIAQCGCVHAAINVQDFPSNAASQVG